MFLVPNKMTRGKGQRQNPLDTETSSRGRGHPLPHCPLSALECSVRCPHPRHVPAPRLCDSQLTRSGTVGRGPDHPKPAPQCVSQRHTYFCPLVRPQVPGTLTWRTHTQNNRSWGSRISFRRQSVTCAEGDSSQVRPTCVQAHPRPSPQLCPLQAFLLRDRFFGWEMAMAILCGRSALRTKTESSRLMLHTPFVLVVSHCLK